MSRGRAIITTIAFIVWSAIMWCGGVATHRHNNPPPAYEISSLDCAVNYSSLFMEEGWTLLPEGERRWAGKLKAKGHGDVKLRNGGLVCQIGIDGVPYIDVPAGLWYWRKPMSSESALQPTTLTTI